MPTLQQQTEAFLSLKQDTGSDKCWAEFWRQWDGFIWTIIRRKLYSWDMQEDAKALTDAKLFRSIDGFDETREIAPWLARVVTSACNDIIKQQDIIKIPRRIEVKKDEKPVIINIDDEAVAAALASMWNEPSSKLEQREIWPCVKTAMEKEKIDPLRQAVFELFYKYGFTGQEIAELYQLSVSDINNWRNAVLRSILPHVKKELAGPG